MQSFCKNLLLSSLLLSSIDAQAQTRSFSPGKGPPVKGQGFKETVPAPMPYRGTTQGRMINPGTDVPLAPDKQTWKLTAKFGGGTQLGTAVPVYSFDGRGERSEVGKVPEGEIIKLDEVRSFAKRHYYVYAWKGQADIGKFGRNPTFWVDGNNIEHAGPAK
jgi:hypothetical protein